MNPPIERQFRLEVGGFTMPVGEVVIGQGFGEELDELRLELRPGRSAQFRDRLVGADRLPVRVPRRQDVIGVRDRDDPREMAGICSPRRPRG